MATARYVIQTDKGAPPLGAYSQGWRAGDFIFVTGTGPIGPDGKVKGTTIEEQTEQAIDNIDTNRCGPISVLPMPPFSLLPARR